MQITMADVRASKMCANGTRKFCEKHGIDWKGAVKQGYIDADVLIATGDAMALRVVRQAQLRNKDC